MIFIIIDYWDGRIDMIRFIATDMDGTLLNDNHEIHEEFDDVFNELCNKEIIFAAASGRQYYNLLKKFENIKDNIIFIAENGSLVIYKGEELQVSSLNRNIAIELIEIGRTIENAYVILCGKKSAYIESSSKRLITQTRKYYEKYEIVEDLTKIEDEILKVTICDFNGAEKNSNHYYNLYKDKVQITVSGEIWLDIICKGVNKGAAISKIQQLLNIKYEETMVFGDYLNDLEMMLSGYYSYAMENAHEDLKKVARFRAKSNNDNGVIDVIKGFI